MEEWIYLEAKMPSLYTKQSLYSFSARRFNPPSFRGFVITFLIYNPFELRVRISEEYWHRINPYAVSEQLGWSRLRSCSLTYSSMGPTRAGGALQLILYAGHARLPLAATHEHHGLRTLPS